MGDDIDTAINAFWKGDVLTAAGFGCLLLGLLGLLVGRLMKWRLPFTMLSCAGLGAAVAVTLFRGGPLPYAQGGCLFNGLSFNDSVARLNFVMLMPFAFFAVLAVRRFLPVALVCGGLSVGIELFQAVSGRGACETQDLLNNTAGGVLAAGIAWLLVRIGRTRSLAGQETLRLTRYDPAPEHPTVPLHHPGGHRQTFR